MFTRFSTNEINHFKKENIYNLITNDYSKTCNMDLNDGVFKRTMFVSTTAFGNSSVIMPANILR